MGPALLAVLPIVVSAEQEAVVSAVFGAVAEAAALRPSLRVLSIDQFYFSEGGAAADRARECGRDDACIAEELLRFNADLGLAVIVDRQVSPAMLGIIALRTRDRVKLAELYAEVSGDLAALSAELRTRVAVMLDRIGYTQHARLVVEVTPRDARIRVGGALAAPDGEGYTLEPGSHVVSAEREGYEPALVQLTLAAGSTQRIAIALEKERELHESPWLWLAAGAALAVASAGVGLALSTTRTCVCIQTLGETDCLDCR